MSPDVWQRLAEPFDDSEVKQRPGRGGMTFSYVDARAVAQRLDDVLTPAGWEFTCSVIPGSDIVKGRLVIVDGDRTVVREDHGYPNSDNDEEPVKAATSDALKRCAVLFGIGRHLYGDNKPGHRQRPAPQRQERPVAPARTSTALPDIEEPEDLQAAFGEVRAFAPIGKPEDAVPDNECPIHRMPWAGKPGDLWHKDPAGRYCRHPDNVKRRAS
jgi:hypothetical protein